VEDVIGASWADLLDLVPRDGRVTQSFEQAAGVTPDAARIGGGTAVEGDPHKRVLDSSRRFIASSRNARQAT
jgi:hypothetical protein